MDDVTGSRKDEAIKTLCAVEAALQAVQSACQAAQFKAVQKLCDAQLQSRGLKADELLTTCSSASTASTSGLSRSESFTSIISDNSPSSAASVCDRSGSITAPAARSLAAARAQQKEKVNATQRSVKFVADLQGKIGDLRDSVAAMRAERQQAC